MHGKIWREKFWKMLLTKQMGCKLMVGESVARPSVVSLCWLINYALTLQNSPTYNTIIR